MNELLKPQEERLFLLIDDDEYSAKFFRRRMNVVAADKINLDLDWFESPARGLSAIQNLAATLQNHTNTRLADLIIVDLKATSDANLNFVPQAAAILRQTSVPLVVFIPQTDAKLAQSLIDAGATECFVRHAELSQYDAELTRIIALSRRWNKAA